MQNLSVLYVQRNNISGAHVLRLPGVQHAHVWSARMSVQKQHVDMHTKLSFLVWSTAVHCTNRRQITGQ